MLRFLKLYFSFNLNSPIQDQSCHHVETSQFIYNWPTDWFLYGLMFCTRFAMGKLTLIRLYTTLGQFFSFHAFLKTSRKTKKRYAEDVFTKTKTCWDSCIMEELTGVIWSEPKMFGLFKFLSYENIPLQKH